MSRRIVAREQPVLAAARRTRQRELPHHTDLLLDQAAQHIAPPQRVGEGFRAGLAAADIGPVGVDLP